MTVINVDKLGGALETFAIIDISTGSRTRKMVYMEGHWRLVESKGQLVAR